MKIRIYLFAVLLVAAVGFAKTPEELAVENEQLRARVEKLENDIAEIKKMLMAQPQASAAAAPAPQDTAVPSSPVVSAVGDTAQPNSSSPQLDDQTVEKLLALAEKEEEPKKSLISNTDVKVYGFMRFDMAYDNSSVKSFFDGAGNGWALPEGTKSDDDSFEATARVTRFGIKAQSKGEEGLVVSGVIEADFCGDGTSSSAEPRLRHGYVKLDWPDDGFSILGGQTWDVVSPLYPNMVDAAVGWFSGNIGFRRPQLRATKIFDLDGESNVEFAAAISRPADSSTYPTAIDSGTDSGVPNFQGRVALTTPMLFERKATIGLSSHYGREEIDYNAGGSDDFKSHSLNLDFTQPITDMLSFKGELYEGRNLDSYLGGIGQGVNAATFEEIDSVGGWGGLSLTPFKKWIFNAGLAVEDVDAQDVNDAAREYNQTMFANCIYNIDTNVSTGLELQHNRTEYKDSDNGNNTRAQMMLMYSF